MSAGAVSEFLDNFSKMLNVRNQLIRQYDPFSQVTEEDDNGVNDTQEHRRHNQHEDGDNTRRHRHRRHSHHRHHHHGHHKHHHIHHHRHHSYHHNHHHGSHTHTRGMEEQFQGHHWLRDTLADALRTRKQFSEKAVEPLFNMQDSLRRLFSSSPMNTEGIFPPSTKQPETPDNSTQAEGVGGGTSPNTQDAPNSLSIAEVIDGIDSKTAEKIRQSAPQDLKFPDPKFLELLQKANDAKTNFQSGTVAAAAFDLMARN